MTGTRHLWQLCQTIHSSQSCQLTHWGWVMHIPVCVGNLTITGSDNGLSPVWRQAIICTNAGILLIGPLGTHFSEISIESLTFSFRKMCLKESSAKWWPFCLSLNELIHWLVGMWLILKVWFSNSSIIKKPCKCEIALRWMSQNITDDRPTLIEVMAWCCKATSHYLQCWAGSMLPYCITSPQWVQA